MKTRIFTATAIAFGFLAASAGSAQAGYPESAYYEYALVLSSEPIYTVERRPVEDRECWDEVVTYERRSESATGMIAGGIIGGIIGNQFGKGHGKQAATVAGTLLGGSIGRDSSHREPRYHHSTEQRCLVSRSYVEEERLSGYRVTYRYDGRTFTRELSYDPGRRLKIRVAVDPVD